MDWLILIFLVPLVLVPIVLLCGFAGCGLDIVGTKAVPAIPTNLVATALGPDKVKLDWKDNSTVASDFIIERGPPGGVLTPIPGIGLVKATTFQDQGLPAATTFLYQVRATFSGASPSTPSNIATVTTLPATPTPPPPPPPPPPSPWKTAYNIPPTTDQAGFANSTIVQLIDTGHLGGAGNQPRTKIKITLRASTTNLVINKVGVSQVTAAGQPWESAPDLVEVRSGGTSGASVPANTTKTLDETPYAFDPTKNLLIAFDISNTNTSVRFAPLPPAAMYSKNNTAEALVPIPPNRSGGYVAQVNRVYLVEKIEVL